MGEEQNVQPSKRRFLGFLGLGALGTFWLGFTSFPVFRFLSPQAPPDPFDEQGRAVVLDITPAEVRNPGMGKNGGYGNRGLIVFRTAEGELKAFDSKCSHAGCNVAFEGEQIQCHCHGGIYDLEGRNVSGPPPRPLTELGVVEDNGVLYVYRLED
jgi:Rieske Fe-S protein